jgi:hypothetical protein
MRPVSRSQRYLEDTSSGIRSGIRSDTHLKANETNLNQTRFGNKQYETNSLFYECEVPSQRCGQGIISTESDLCPQTEPRRDRHVHQANKNLSASDRKRILRFLF